ncbi:DUF4082 domain-containing protein [Microlunatus antarcticus]|uniref:Methionine-rich copper-binding protein CopC n=1 Tax=Microlunatus antarcticus TaxID=53388 RepID=A0A7W5JTV0_9ACTN|nr:DUF4082 domain-containing protein [Microlunatus antarcticus]MBB3326110.1 methionine-rich copper-binding protein CopC [Microlunatus antarcticus]
MAVVATFLVLPATPAAAACSGNAIVCENQLPGESAGDWDVFGAGDDTIQGFATATSVNVGASINFKINTDARAYSVKIYRLGWYQGTGARLITTIAPSAPLPQVQPPCATDASTELTDCGTWGVSASWNVPSTAVSGIYIARLTRTDTGGDSHIPFVVRNDGNTSAAVFQTSDSTWQAYNTYGGSDFYEGKANGRAYKISYNRPYLTRGTSYGRDFLFSNEYPMLRFLEQNGVDVSYVSGLDVATDPALLRKHKVFLSVGHDEYWTKEQRKNVTDARDAGVNLAFFGGNDVYWKTRLEPSQDGTSTPNRTIVDYKNTWANAAIDPVEPTATWRDPRFGDLGYGYGPENGLIGTLYQANSDDFPMQVSSEEGKLRVWRGTTLASMANGAKATLADHMVGYESNEDIDNGYRPDGLIDMSTAVGNTPEYLRDFGNQVSPGTTTHHITLYRASSGALVFSAGTIQWSWGLDSRGDGADRPAADPRVRQATINLLTDMAAPATTLASDLTPVTASTDTVAPSVVVTAPASGQSLTQGSLLTVNGTATDTGGRVAGVEVSVDGGASFHPASGTTSWSYSGILTGNGPSAVQVRATDDSARTSAPVLVAVTSTCPCSIFGVATPLQVDPGDGSPVTVGTKFTSSRDGYVSGIRFYKAAANTGTHTGTLYSTSGTVLATGTFTNETASGWQTLQFSQAVAINAGTTYVAAYYAPVGHYSADSYYFGKPYNAGVLTAAGGSGVTNGVYADRSAFPTNSIRQTNYYVDAVFSPDDTIPATVTTVSPRAGASSVATSTVAAATFSKAVDPATISMQLIDAAQNVINGTVSWNAATRTATFNPVQGLASSTAYTATVNAATLAAPVQWTFSTVDPDATPNECPCTLFNDSDQPASGPADDSGGVKLGVAFKASQDGQITGARFWKRPEETAPHTVNLWSGSTKVAEATTINETTSGWQEATFAAPQTVTKGTTYVVSYTSSTGKYGYTSNGLADPVTNGPLSTSATAGRYTYGAGDAPTNSSNANYFVDPVFVPSAATKPTVLSTSPGDGARSVPVDDHLQIRFNTAIQPGSATVKVVRTSDGNPVAGTVGAESQGTTATFVPSSDLAPGTKYTLTVSDAISTGGPKMSGSISSSFTTSGAAACPCSLMETTTRPVQSDGGDGDAVTLGLKFTPTTTGFVKGLRYWRDASNTGTHTGALYSATGQKLAGLTFDDSGTGWQTASFSTNVPVTAGTTYVASYYAPKGHYAADLNYFTNPVVNTPLASADPGSLYAYGDTFPDHSYANTNYYVDVVFDTNDDAALQVSSITPPKGSTGVATTTAVSATFSRDVDPSSVQLTLADAAGNLVGGQVVYDAATKKVTFTTAAPLSGATTYTATATAASASGVAMTAPRTWSFTTADTQPPSVTTVSPADGSTGVTTAAKVVATFASPIDPASALFTVARSDTSAVAAGATTYDATTRTATFTPTSALADNAAYTVSVSARNTSGISMAAPRTWSFTTADTQPPMVSTTSPSPGATGVGASAKVTAVFVRAVDPASVVVSVKNTSTSAAVAGTTAYDAGSRTATFTPSAAFAGLTGYTASVTAKNVSGVAMTAPQTWTFTTADSVAPTVTAVTPAAGATNVGATTTVTATFARAVDPATVQLVLKTAGGTTVAGATSLDAGNLKATFTPGAALAGVTGYTASVTAKNASGVAMSAPRTWSFTTADTDAPTLSSRTPAAGAANVAAGTNVTATFARPVTTSSITVSLKTASGAMVAGAGSYNTSTRVVTFNPTADLTSSTTYTASVGATSSTGVPMTSPATWTFTTAAQSFSLYTTTRTPSTSAVSTTTPTTVGVRFSSTRAGSVTAIRYYASSVNTGRTVKLWAADGSVLGTATTTQTTTGWRTATFSTPVAVAAGTTYTASYYAPVGRWSTTTGSYASAFTSGPLTVPASGGVTGNGDVLPTIASTTNYWVDVVVSI